MNNCFTRSELHSALFLLRVQVSGFLIERSRLQALLPARASQQTLSFIHRIKTSVLPSPPHPFPPPPCHHGTTTKKDRLAEEKRIEELKKLRIELIKQRDALVNHVTKLQDTTRAEVADDVVSISNNLGDMVKLDVNAVVQSQRMLDRDGDLLEPCNIPINLTETFLPLEKPQFKGRARKYNVTLSRTKLIANSLTPEALEHKRIYQIEVVRRRCNQDELVRQFGSTDFKLCMLKKLRGSDRFKQEKVYDYYLSLSLAVTPGTDFWTKMAKGDKLRL